MALDRLPHCVIRYAHMNGNTKVTFKNGDLVRIRKEWRGQNDNGTSVYTVVNDEPGHNGRILIALVCNMAIPPVEAVESSMIEAT